MCISRWPPETCSDGDGLRRGYHTGQPSVLDALDSHLLHRRNWRRGLDKMNSKGSLKLHGFMYYEFTCTKQFLYSWEIKFHDPCEIIPLCLFFVLRQKMYYWFLIQPQTMWLREKSIEWGVRKPRFSPQTTQEEGWEVGAVWPWAIVFTSLSFSFPSIKWKEWLSVLQFFPISKPMKSSPSPKV